jgi:BirA family transcriptional regulator, biotin operon repressor / biotin---[acetyl-CoA-carboxylase] ligase
MAVSLPSGLEPRSLLARLADGELHTGAALLRELKVNRAALGEAIERLRAQGVEIITLARRGYRLPKPVELLDPLRICAGLSSPHEIKLRRLEVLFEVDSTNTRLLGLPSPPAGQADVCMSELQHSGRGRRGRRWLAPFGDSLAVSLGWTWRDATRVEPALSLAVGVAIASGLARAGARGISLKWPNDIWFNDRKIGGVLIELRADASGSAHAVIGIGLNVYLSAAARRELAQAGVRAAAVVDACPSGVSRNGLAGALLDELLSMLERFEREGFAPFRDSWLGLDALRGRRAQVLAGDLAVAGTVRGVDADGALLLESAGQMQRFVSGEVSLRLTEVVA